jgi:hypothetical protein
MKVCFCIYMTLFFINNNFEIGKWSFPFLAEENSDSQFFRPNRFSWVSFWVLWTKTSTSWQDWGLVITNIFWHCKKAYWIGAVAHEFRSFYWKYQTPAHYTMRLSLWIWGKLFLLWPLCDDCSFSSGFVQYSCVGIYKYQVMV